MSNASFDHYQVELQQMRCELNKRLNVLQQIIGVAEGGRSRPITGDHSQSAAEYSSELKHRSVPSAIPIVGRRAKSPYRETTGSQTQWTIGMKSQLSLPPVADRSPDTEVLHAPRGSRARSPSSQGVSKVNDLRKCVSDLRLRLALLRECSRKPEPVGPIFEKYRRHRAEAALRASSSSCYRPIHVTDHA